jgi:hypothetical protein
VRVHASLLLDYLREKTPLHSEKSLLLQKAALFARYKQWQAHPKGHAYYNFEDDTSQRPYINSPRISIVIHDLLIKFFLVYSFILMDDVVEYFWRHVFWCCHGELCYVSELEGGAIVDEFHFF